MEYSKFFQYCKVLLLTGYSTSAVEDLEDIIEAYEDGDGKRYLKIRMDNDITFRTFERREGR
jgi:hypothetical protein